MRASAVLALSAGCRVARSGMCGEAPEDGPPSNERDGGRAAHWRVGTPTAVCRCVVSGLRHDRNGTGGGQAPGATFRHRQHHRAAHH